MVHSHLEVPVGGRPGSHELSAGGGEEAVNIAPQLTGLKPTNSSIFPISFGLRLYIVQLSFHPKVQIRVMQLKQLVYERILQTLAHYA